MAQAVEEVLGNEICGGIVVTKYGHSLPVERIEIVEAGHPIPDSAGVEAVQRTRELLSSLGANDIVICSGFRGRVGASGRPRRKKSRSRKNRKLPGLCFGLARQFANSTPSETPFAVKGGQLAEWAAPAKVISLIMSDVIGDPLDFIASGPTAPDTTSFSGRAFHHSEIRH